MEMFWAVTLVKSDSTRKSRSLSGGRCAMSTAPGVKKLIRPRQAQNPCRTYVQLGNWHARVLAVIGVCRRPWLATQCREAAHGTSKWTPVRRPRRPRATLLLRHVRSVAQAQGGEQKPCSLQSLSDPPCMRLSCASPVPGTGDLAAAPEVLTVSTATFAWTESWQSGDSRIANWPSSERGRTKQLQTMHEEAHPRSC